jgi:hypothetical protein
MNKHVKLAVLFALTVMPITIFASDMSPQEVKNLIQRADKNMFPSFKIGFLKEAKLLKLYLDPVH